MKNLTKNKIIELHNKIIKETGGESGILFEGTLDFIEKFLLSDSSNEKDILRFASKILSRIIRGHPFIDGNKRTGFEATDVFLV